VAQLIAHASIQSSVASDEASPPSVSASRAEHPKPRQAQRLDGIGCPVTELEVEVATLLGKQAALFFPVG
jgi:hypothetical protein